jgi:integration host factor subunit beta
MATVSKKELIDRICEQQGASRAVVRTAIQAFLDQIINELASGNRLEFRDFGVFETKVRAARRAQNPKTLERVDVPSRRTVKFKVGHLMREALDRSMPGAAGDGKARRTPVPAADGAARVKVNGPRLKSAS